MEPRKRPLNTLIRSLNHIVIIKLKDNTEYKGRMIRCDNYLNLLLEGATEIFGSKTIANYGNVFIRGNNILYISINSDRFP
ncbi:ribonucleoprotein [Candidatus Bathyarchaeota archaeon]|nr:ribonucleoprotein [Candidatus Bathyarchaeota archaeon]